MNFTIAGGTTHIVGYPVLVHITGIVVPAGAVNYAVAARFTNLDTLEEWIVSLDAPFVGNAASMSYDPEAGTYDLKVEVGFSYNDSLNGMELVEDWEASTQTIQIFDSTSVTIGGVEIPGGSVQLSGNPIEIRVGTTAEAMEGKTNFRIALRINCAALMGAPYVEEIAPGADLTSVFDISGFVDQPVTQDFDYPVRGAVNPHDAQVFHLTIDTGEVYIDANGDRIPSWNGDLTGYEMRIVKGKLRSYELALLNEVGKSFFTEYIQGGKFLTRQPNFQKIAPHHIPRLWYLSRWADNHPFTAHLKINTADKVAHIPITQNHTLWSITGLVDFAFQPEFWGSYYDNVESFEFWLTDANGDISDHRTYVVDHGYYEKSFTFYYFNPLSGLDLQWLTGEHTEGVKTESEIAYRPVPFGSGSKVGSLATISASGQRTWSINTGHKLREEMLGMRDFLEAKKLWMVDPDNYDRLIPVVIESGDFSLYDSMKDVQNFEIKILEAHR
ncbi:MAG TPA: hypothetical protein VFG54_12155 [Prolixibacteraceae bacterium]|nr:hypothetical protein [Prolixibacteraceae bacterium]